MVPFAWSPTDTLREPFLGQFCDTQANKLSLKHFLHKLEFITQYSQVWWGPYLEVSASLLQNLVALLH